MVRLRGLEHVRVTVREDNNPEGSAEAGEGRGDLRERAKLLDLGHQVAHLVQGVRDPRALENPGQRPVADLPVWGVLPLQEGIDHRVLEVHAAPPGHEGVGIARPALPAEVRGDRLGESRLHVDHGAVLIEHAHLDPGSKLGRARH
jgi:hypothetical protein